MTDISDINVKTPLFSIGAKIKDSRILLKEGETVIIKYNIGKWYNPKYIRKALTLKDGRVEVQVIDI